MQERPFNHTGFQQYLAEGRLMGTRCAHCGRRYLPPRSLCTACYSTDMEWQEFSGQGVLSGFSSIAVGLPAMLAEGYHRQRPYCVGVVTLAEGPAISAQITSPEGDCPPVLQVGMPVQVAFLKRGNGAALAFQPKQDSPG